MILGALVIVIVGILLVNYFKDKSGETTPVALTTTTTQAQVGKTHNVAKGESLWSIAEEAYGSGYNWTDIYNANKLKSQAIEVGQKLEIPDVTVKKPTAAKKTFDLSVSPQPITNSSYTVVHGDTLWSIAVRTYGDGYKWVNIAKANKLVKANVIHAGNVLTLPR